MRRKRWSTIANFRDWRDRSSIVRGDVELPSWRKLGDATGALAEYGRIASVDAQFFRVFAVEPIIGRTFRPMKFIPNAPPNVLISHSYWQNRLGGDPRVLERTIRVGNTARSIIGVLPPGFRFPAETDVWLPQTTSSTSRTGHNFFAVGRLKPGVSLEQGQADLTNRRGRARTRVSRKQQRARRHRDAFAGRTRRRRPSHAVSPVGRRRCRVADCVRQHSNAAAGQGNRCARERLRFAPHSAPIAAASSSS